VSANGRLGVRRCNAEPSTIAWMLEPMPSHSTRSAATGLPAPDSDRALLAVVVARPEGGAKPDASWRTPHPAGPDGALVPAVLDRRRFRDMLRRLSSEIASGDDGVAKVTYACDPARVVKVIGHAIESGRPDILLLTVDGRHEGRLGQEAIAPRSEGQLRRLLARAMARHPEARLRRIKRRRRRSST
jgi:hypothetical protein